MFGVLDLFRHKTAGQVCGCLQEEQILFFLSVRMHIHMVEFFGIQFLGLFPIGLIH